MRTWREYQITRAIQGYDPKLYAVKGYEDRIDILRKGYRYETYDVDGVLLTVPVEEPHRVISLTDTWGALGKPVEWGIEPILAKIQACDLWKRDVGGEVIANREKQKEDQDRKRKNDIEGFLIDNRRMFAKAFDGINTSSLDKKVDRRYLDDKKLKG